MEILIQSQEEFDRSSSTQLRYCKWNYCSAFFGREEEFLDHVKEHAQECEPIRRKQFNLNKALGIAFPTYSTSATSQVIASIPFPPNAQLENMFNSSLESPPIRHSPPPTEAKSVTLSMVLPPPVNHLPVSNLSDSTQNRDMLDWLTGEVVKNVEPEAPSRVEVEMELATQANNGEADASFVISTGGSKESDKSFQGGYAQPR